MLLVSYYSDYIENLESCNTFSGTFQPNDELEKNFTFTA